MTSRALEEVHECLSVIRAREHTAPRDLITVRHNGIPLPAGMHGIYSIRCCGVYSFQAEGGGRCLLEGGIQ